MMVDENNSANPSAGAGDSSSPAGDEQMQSFEFGQPAAQGVDPVQQFGGDPKKNAQARINQIHAQKKDLEQQNLQLQAQLQQAQAAQNSMTGVQPTSNPVDISAFVSPTPNNEVGELKQMLSEFVQGQQLQQAQQQEQAWLQKMNEEFSPTAELSTVAGQVYQANPHLQGLGAQGQYLAVQQASQQIELQQLRELVNTNGIRSGKDAGLQPATFAAPQADGAEVRGLFDKASTMEDGNDRDMLIANALGKGGLIRDARND